LQLEIAILNSQRTFSNIVFGIGADPKIEFKIRMQAASGRLRARVHYSCGAESAE
jgi:hypothetical protein